MFALSPGRFVGAPEAEEDEIEIEEQIGELLTTLAGDLADNTRLTEALRESLAKIGYEL